MVWSKKKILFILSVIFVVISSCNSKENKILPKEVIVSKDSVISNFFNHFQSRSDESIVIIDSLGAEIGLLDSSLTFLPYSNEYESNSFVFVAQNKLAFKPFEENSFLSDNKEVHDSDYKVWRKNIQNSQILDISIEPHPILKYILSIRFRGQE